MRRLAPSGGSIHSSLGRRSLSTALSLNCHPSFMDTKLYLRYPFSLMQPVRLDIAQQTESNGTLVARLSGKLALETVSGFLQQMRPIEVERMVLDMSGVTYLDSAGVGALVQLFVHRRANSRKLAVAALTTQGAAVMQVAGLMKLIPTFATVVEASAP